MIRTALIGPLLHGSALSRPSATVRLWMGLPLLLRMSLLLRMGLPLLLRMSLPLLLRMSRIVLRRPCARMRFGGGLLRLLLVFGVLVLLRMVVLREYWQRGRQTAKQNSQTRSIKPLFHVVLLNRL
jgi:hypothetical protein